MFHDTELLTHFSVDSWRSGLTFLTGMNALFVPFHNFILPLVREEEREGLQLHLWTVKAIQLWSVESDFTVCSHGFQHQVYHVVPYSMVASRENDAVSDIMTQQEMNVIVGLLSGLCIGFFLQWLDII